MRFPLKTLLFCVFLPLFCFSQQQYETKILHGAANGSIVQYETMEIGIRFPARERMYKLFLEDQSKGKNPFQSHFLRIQFNCHGKSYNIPAFYMQDANADESQNKYLTENSNWPWRVRFAIPDTGIWDCNLLIGEEEATSIPQYCPIAFKCVKGKNNGFIQLAPDKRHFQYTDGTPFFALGQNIAWADEPVLNGRPGPPPVYISGYFDMFHYLNDLADNGGNYVRVVMIHWSTGIEWEQTGYYAQDRAWVLDSILRLAETRGLKIQLCVDLTTGFDSDTTTANWHCYRKSFQKKGMTAADILNDSAALLAMDNFIRYVYARWAFSPAVATIELMGEQNRWDGFDAHQVYFNNFFSHVNRLIRDDLHDQVHFISTSCSNTDHPSIYENDAIGFIDMHHYDNDFRCNQKRFHFIHRRSSEKLDKPFLFGELGMTNGPYNNSDADDFEGCNDVSFHNSIWATLFMGDAGVGLNWWQWKNDNYRKSNFPIARFFIDSIARGTLFSGVAKMWVGNGLETFYQLDAKSNVAIGWVHNTSYWWGNMMQDCRDRNGKGKILPKDDDKATKVEDRTGNKFIITGLMPNGNFEVVFYDTRVKGKILDTQKLKSNRFGKLAAKFPAGCADCAFRILQPYSVHDLNWSF